MKLTLCTVLAVTLAVCSRGHDQQHTWKDRMPAVDCGPRMPEAKAELTGCPKLADFQHPTLAEQRKIVSYLNRKNQIEGTIDFGEYFPPGCATWSLDPAKGVPKITPTYSAHCGNNFQDKLRDFNIPGPQSTPTEKERKEP